MPYHSAANDVWSLGIILFCVYFGAPPWRRPSTSCISFNSFLVDPDYFLRRYPISIEFHNLLMRVFTMDPRRRITLPELISEYQTINRFLLTSTTEILNTHRRHLRPISYPLVWEHVWRELPALLDVSKFLHDRGIEASPPQPPPAEPPRRSFHDQLWHSRPEANVTRTAPASKSFDSMELQLDLEDVDGALTLAGFGPSTSANSAYWTPASDISTTRDTSQYFGSGDDSEEGSSSASSELIATPVQQKLPSLESLAIGVVDPSNTDAVAQSEAGTARKHSNSLGLLDFMAGRFGTIAGAFHKHSPPAANSPTYTPATKVFGGAPPDHERGRMHWL